MSNERYAIDESLLALVRRLHQPVGRDELIRVVAQETRRPEEQLQAAFDRLLETGTIKQSADVMPSSSYTVAYGSMLKQRGMLTDRPRTHGFRRAIEAVVKPGQTVVDVGCGTGILSYFAARAGAERVHAIDNTLVIEDAKEIAKANGFADKVRFFSGDAGDFAMDGKADFIVSEWIGYFLMEEYMYGAFCQVRDKYLAEGGAVCPSAARVYITPVEDPTADEHYGLGYWSSSVYGFDYSLGRGRQLDRMNLSIMRFSPTAYLSEPWKILDLNCLEDPQDAFHFKRTGAIEFWRSGSCHGFGGHFELDLAPGVTLDTSAYSVSTHWQQVYFPFERLDVHRGDKLEVQLESRPGGVRPEFLIKCKHVRAGETLATFEHLYHGE